MYILKLIVVGYQRYVVKVVKAE